MYAWGKMRGVPLFQDTIVDAMVAKLAEGSMPIEIVQKIYDCTAGEVPVLRKIATECYGHMEVTDFDNAMRNSSQSSSLPVEFWIDLAVFLKHLS